MPKLPVLSGNDVVRILRLLGFETIRQRKSHVILRRDNAGCVVPLHRELKSGTLAGIIRQAGLTQDDFLASMKA